jgi:hypothetical protein
MVRCTIHANPRETKRYTMYICTCTWINKWVVLYVLVHFISVSMEIYYWPFDKFFIWSVLWILACSWWGVPYMPTLERLKAVEGLGFAMTLSPQKIVFQKDAKWCILLHFGYKICSVKSLNIVWKNHEKMENSWFYYDSLLLMGLFIKFDCSRYESSNERFFLA